MANVQTSAEKNAKAQQIAAAAWQLFSQHAFSDISMAMIAQQAGVAKGTLFNYYQSKESIFMTLLLTGYRDYFTTLAAEWTAKPVANAAQLKTRLVDQTRTLISDHATLVRLNALRGPVLESHADRAQTEQGRRNLYAANLALGRVVATQVPTTLSAAQASHLFVIQSAIISGLMNLTGLDQFNHTTLNVDFPAFQIDLTAEVCQTFGYYLDGILR
ncbi:TetR/AcrR family transcriptional regulator [Levilactobacillus andaensis]|uniref:TetR/AcrR family transcriptional regulator n=1 Tax=Levilactobacillus andaensis TaxID=2799570 RepID=UPI001944BE2B|nr:TetR/AcrR family transcriptional regulator [Levilactobacillus andaensis]